MSFLEPLVQVEKIEDLERALAAARKSAARALRTARHAKGLSLRQVAPKVRLTAPTISSIERGALWRTKTIRRLALFYSKFSVGDAAA